MTVWLALRKKIVSVALTGAGFVLLVYGVIRIFFNTPGESLPTGTLKIAGIREPLEISIDRNGIWQIAAANQSDQDFAIGFMQAQQNLLRLDALKRLASGCLSEVWGRRYLEWDRYARQLGFQERAQAVSAGCPSEVQSALGAYCAGYNANLTLQNKHLPPEFARRGYRPAKWSPPDCIALMLIMHWLNQVSWDEKIWSYKVAEILGPQKMQDGFPAVAWETTQSANFGTTFFPVLDVFLQTGLELRAFAGLSGNGSGLRCLFPIDSELSVPSNALVIETTNFPPECWMAAVSTPTTEFMGLFLPGTPFVCAARSAELAWGVNLLKDSRFDLLVIPTDSIRRQSRTESIACRNRKPYAFVRYSVGGLPLLDFSGVRQATDSNAVALAWSSWTAEDFVIWYALTYSSNPDNIRDYASQLTVPHELIWCPTGGYPGESVNPGAQKIIPNGNCINLTALQVTDFSGQTAEPAFASTLTTSTRAAQLIGNLAAIVPDTILSDGLVRRALKALVNWDGAYTDSSAEATIYTELLARLAERIYADELRLVDATVMEQLLSLPNFLELNLAALLEGGESSWFDNLQTPDISESRATILQSALEIAVQKLRAGYSGNFAQWQWYRMKNNLRLTSPVISRRLTGPYRNLLNQNHFPVNEYRITFSPSDAEKYTIAATGGEQTSTKYGTTRRPEIVRQGARLILLIPKP